MQGKHAQYFEATLQLRNPSEEILDFVQNEIEKADIHIAKTVELKNGLDHYLSDNNFAKTLGKKLQQQFGGELTVTASLYSRKDGRDIYRLTVLFRALQFKKGDIVNFKGENYEIKNIDKEIFLQKVKTNEKIRVKYKDMQQLKEARE